MKIIYTIQDLIPGSYYIRKGEEIKQFEYEISNKVQEELKNLLWNKIKEEAKIKLKTENIDNTLLAGLTFSISLFLILKEFQ